MDKHTHKGRVWEIFPCEFVCYGTYADEPEMDDHWLNGWIFDAFNWVMWHFLHYVMNVEEPGMRVLVKNPCFKGKL